MLVALNGRAQWPKVQHLGRCRVASGPNTSLSTEGKHNVRRDVKTVGDFFSHYINVISTRDVRESLSTVQVKEE